MSRRHSGLIDVRVGDMSYRRVGIRGMRVRDGGAIQRGGRAVRWHWH